MTKSRVGNAGPDTMLWTGDSPRDFTGRTYNQKWCDLYNPTFLHYWSVFALLVPPTIGSDTFRMFEEHEVGAFELKHTRVIGERWYRSDRGIAKAQMTFYLPGNLTYDPKTTRLTLQMKFTDAPAKEPINQTAETIMRVKDWTDSFVNVTLRDSGLPVSRLDMAD